MVNRLNTPAMTELDRQLAADLQERLPPRLFDAHAHLWRQADFEQPAAGIWAGSGDEATPAVWREHLAPQVGAARLAGALFIPVPYPRPKRIAAVNAWVLASAAACPGSRALALVAPEMPPDELNPLMASPVLAGFKPYHTFSPVQPTFQAPLQTFLPEWAWALAHERRLVITLHLVRDQALADPENQREIRACCERYPRARLILAHAARGFHAPNTVRGLAALRGLGNVWFDTSGICERDAFEAILREFGPRRLMWGTDYPVSQIRGRCVTVGDGFAWLEADSVNWEKTGPQGRPTLVGLESLRALLAAADAFGLDEADLQDLFAGNAERLLGLAAEEDSRTEAADPPADSLLAGVKHVRLFVLTGQSNSLGTTADPAEPEPAPPTDPRDMDIPFFWRNRSTRAGDGPAMLFGDSGGKILPLQAQQGEGANPLFWGPEIGFGRRLAATGETGFLIVKASRGGGGNRFWLKGSADDHMYRHVVETVRQAVSALPEGVSFEIAALLYVQGESDSADEASASGERLRLLAENLRQDLPQAANMRVLVGGIAAPGASRDIVRGQQANLPARDGRFRYIDSLDLRPLLYDQLHFNKTAKLELGRRLADAWLADRALE